MTALIIIRWVLAVLLGLFWLLCAVGNMRSLISAARRHGSTSFILFFGGVAGVAAVLLCPFPEMWRWFWLPALLDIGTIPCLVAMIYGGAFTKQAKKTTPVNSKD